MEINPVFVYQRGKKVKVLKLGKAKESENYLRTHGWKHIATIEPGVWIECLLNSKNPNYDVHELLTNKP